MCNLSNDNNKKLDYTIVISFFLVTLGTLLCDFNSFFQSELKSKWYWLYLSISVCCLLFLFVRLKKSLKIDSSGFFLIFIFSYSFLLALSSQFVFSFLLQCILFFIIYILSFQVIDKQIFKIFSILLSIIAFFMSLYGLAQYFGLLQSGEHFNIVGSFNNPIGYTSMLALCTPFTLHLSLSIDKRWIRNFVRIGFMIICTAVVLSTSRTGIIAIIISSYFFFTRKNKTFRKIATWKKIIIFLLISIIFSSLYFLKKDSANGRILIWGCTLDMIQEKPLFGHGYKSFKAKYMLYQANYFEKNPESKFAVLADNVQHPFNEFLLLISEFGLIAFLLLVLFVANLMRKYLKNQNEMSFILILVLVSILILSCFSYPFQYPFTLLIVAFCLGSLSALSYKGSNPPQKRWIFNSFIILSSIVIIVSTVKEMYYENRWYKTVANRKKWHGSMYVIKEYEALYPFMKNNAYFIYNYAAKLNNVGNIEKSAEIAIDCEIMLNDYDVQMLMADNYKELEKYAVAEQYFKKASAMCPIRFMPLYELVKLYQTIGNNDEALTLAKRIFSKEEKIPSSTITAIKLEMQRFIEEQEEIEMQ